MFHFTTFSHHQLFIYALLTLLSSLVPQTECVNSNTTSDLRNEYEIEGDDVRSDETITFAFPNSVNVNFSDLIYKKCYCDIQKIWSNGKCVTVDTEAVMSILQDLQPNSETFLSFIFSEVEIKDIHCSSNNQAVDVTQDDFYILESGELYHSEADMFFSKENYCFELVQRETSIETLARVCLPPPKVPLCCENGVDCDAGELKLNTLFGRNLLHWDNLTFFEAQPLLSCGKDNDLLNLALTNNVDNLNFFYNAGYNQLLWKPPLPARIPFVYSQTDYCIIKNKLNTSYEIQICYNDPVKEHKRRCQNSVCVRKCCPKGYNFSTAMGKCIPNEFKQLSLPLFYNFQNKSLATTPETLIIEYDSPWCSPQKPYLIDPQENPADKFMLLNNGSLYSTLSNLMIPPSKYCVDNFLDGDNSSSFKAITCFLEKKETEDHCKNVRRILYPTLIAISCVFLAITLTVYAAVPELHSKQLHGKSLLSHVLSLLIAFLFQLIVNWSSKSLSMTWCKIMALGNQVSFLWAFFWLNAMCFDIWWTLKTMNPSQETGESARRRFFLYSLYSWGCPLLISFITAVLEFLPSSVDKSGLILPGFGVRGCWFQDEKSTWIYFHGFTLFLYVLNIIFFFHVAAILVRGQKSTEGILRTTRKQHKERAFLYLKLFVVMGITWVCEVVSWQEGTCEYWIFTDIINSLQGVFIFFIFMCNKKVFQKVQAKGVPIFRRMKTLVQPPSSVASAEIRSNSSSQRTTQTSVESSLRKLSSSLPPTDVQLTYDTKEGVKK